VTTLIIALGAAVVLWAAITLMLFVTGRRSSARELATFVPNLLFLFRGLLGDPEVPRRAKIWLGVGVAWIASPVDLIPEFIPVAGPLDDAIVAALVLRVVVRRAGSDVVRRHWRGGEGSLGIVLRLAGAGPRSPT
jgi:uncharacterized membrane protein YkvA (DUF1232 family)